MLQDMRVQGSATVRRAAGVQTGGSTEGLKTCTESKRGWCKEKQGMRWGRG
jgi:hypothetical protein